MAKVSERLQTFMDMTGFSQTDIIRMCKPYCELYGVKLTKSALSQYISGAREPKYNKLKIMEMAFHISADWLAGYTDDMNAMQTNDFDEISNLFKLLNASGKQKAIDYITDLAENPKYRKDDDS